jgi:hypothetical protein
MPQTMGETREAMSRGCMELVEDFVNNMKHEVKPFYIMYAAKPDHNTSEIDGRKVSGAIKQAIKATSIRPPKLLGFLVWYVDNSRGIFEFLPELSSPPDIPLDESLLSDRPEDFFPSIASKASSFNVLVS